MYIYKIYNIGRNEYEGTSLYFSDLDSAIEFSHKMHTKEEWGELSSEWDKTYTKLRMYTDKRFCLETIIKIWVNE